MTVSTSGEEVAGFIKERLDYLVTSRPTAVNLADAAGKLRKIVSNAASQGDDGSAVAKAYCDATAQMLVDDVSDNRGIGEHGAEWIVKNVKSEKVSVLTHCNTG
jgi:methylthioribose-1-phosphate isomerase